MSIACFSHLACRFAHLQVLLMLILMTGCSLLPSPEQRRQQALETAASQDWTVSMLSTDHFQLTAFEPRNRPKTKNLRVYIEGDGLAWISRHRPSSDPTPRTPMALLLALQDSYRAVAYLARPCQYGSAATTACEPRFWTSHRYAETVVLSMGQALDQLKKQWQATTLELVGYSGGATVAALLAARRDDVKQLITVAGNLDHAYWTQLHQITPLHGSLNPADFAGALAHVRQRHLVGEKDSNITPEVVFSYVRRLPADAPVAVHIIKGFDHACCWQHDWPQLLEKQR